MSNAPASTKATVNGALNCGLLNVPIAVFSGIVSDHGVTRHQFVTVTDDDGNTEDHPVGSKPYDKVTGDDVDKASIIKKIDTEYGEVYVEDHEIEALFDVLPNSVTIKEFQPQHLFYQGNYVPKRLYYIEPAKALKGSKKVPSPANNKALGTLLKAMKEEGLIAVCELVQRGNPQPAILLPNGSLWAVYHTDQVREQRPLPEVEIVEAEVNMIRMLTKAMYSEQPMDLTDERSALIQGFADEKAANGDFGKPEAPAEPAAPVADTNFMDLIAASVEAAKKKQA